MIRIDTSELQTNMILGEDIYNHLGVLFISSGSILTRGMIESLKDMKRSAVDIIEKEEPTGKSVVIVDHKVQVKYEETVHRFKTLFKGIKFGGKAASKDVCNT